jgi:predicted transposase
MKQTVVLQLEPTPAQFRALQETMEAFNLACQHVADVAYEHRTSNKIALQPLVYGELRKRFNLSAQMAVRALSKACEAYRKDKRVHVRFDPQDAMIFDQRILSFKGLTEVSLLCLSGRQRIPFRFVTYQAARPDRVKGQADLILQEGKFRLEVCIDLPTGPAKS